MYKQEFKVGDWIISTSGKSRAFVIDNQYNIKWNNICGFGINTLRLATKEEIEKADLSIDNNIVENFPIY